MSENKERVSLLLETLKDKIDAISEYEIESLDAIIEIIESKKELIEEQSEELQEEIEEIKNQFEDDEDDEIEEKTDFSEEEIGNWANGVSQTSRKILLENVMDESLDQAIKVLRENARKLYESFDETIKSIMNMTHN
ncbi:MAG: hypothetical protein GX421_04095 [Caldisericales bacterium]|nr:hypothetical protein [Caldisericales bacterium]